MLKLTPSTAAIDHRTDLREGTGGSTATYPAVLYRYHFLLPSPHSERRMIDRFRLWAKGGDGGSGCFSLRRSRQDRHGRPDEPCMDINSYYVPQHAKRGGHGASKKKIGSRGTDKVVQVPVGTVIHLVEGEVPATVEKISSTALDPWEISGTLDVDPSESAQKSSSTCASEEERVETVNKSKLSSCVGKRVEESVSAKKATQAVLTEPLPESVPSYKRPKCHTEDYEFWTVEGGIEMEGLETESEICESEWEEGKEETEQIQFNVAELTEPGQRVIIACGGKGGLGNVSSPKASKKRNLIKDVVQKDNDFDVEVSDDEPSSLSAGSPGSEVLLVLELKSIADVGLVGMPNAGKSTLLGAMSRAKPTVGHYAFTTLRPNLGNLNYDEFSVKVADIPGIIKGAHENRGLGHAFLRHIERTKVLAYVVDLAAALDGRKGIPPWEQLRDLILELEFYSEGLSDRPSLVVANKIDEEGAEEVFEELKRRVSGVPVFPVCAVLEEGISEVKEGLRMLVNGGDSYRLRLDGIMTESTD
ncbi:hypothetical protein RHMOL_Rhmol13G0101100 [Rhododendron molle]|uniref:Uncharacterized protein n=1 Tax=Rhododendron molle TaxID=49168 RepID=A0ACC0L618_RHOML|nr:hypothetical protein RHMOL_Rhmol13G0101100 [Rhododendron molle]